MNLFSYCTILPNRFENPRNNGERSIIRDNFIISILELFIDPKNISVRYGIRKNNIVQEAMISSEKEEKIESIVFRRSLLSLLLVNTGTNIEADTSEAIVAKSTSGILKAA